MVKENNTIGISTDIGEGLIFLGIVLLFIAFWGEPDVIDGLIHFLMNCAGCG